MLLLKKVGTIFFMLGLFGILGPFVGVVLKGTKPDESRFIGELFMGFGVTIFLVAVLLDRIQESIQKRRGQAMRQNAKPPDDIIR